MRAPIEKTIDARKVVWYVYLIRNSDDSRLYCGVTTDPNRRIRQHNGEIPGGARATRAKRPWSFVYLANAPTKSAALRREIVIKKMTRKEKLSLI
jgi:putative endonuclease